MLLPYLMGMIVTNSRMFEVLGKKKVIMFKCIKKEII